MQKRTRSRASIAISGHGFFDRVRKFDSCRGISCAPPPEPARAAAHKP